MYIGRYSCKYGSDSPEKSAKLNETENLRLVGAANLKPNIEKTTVFRSENMHEYDLAFVNRENIAFKVASALVDSSSYDHGLLVHIGQHNGSGKTTFVRNFKRIMDGNNLWMQLEQTRPSRKKIIGNLRKAKYVEINCREFPLKDQTSMSN
jgi:beta-xylosidase